MKTYLIFKVILAIKVAIFSFAIYLLANLIFQKNNFDFLDISSKDMKLTRTEV